MILEHGVGASSVSKAWSGYLDSVLGYPVSVRLVTVYKLLRLKFDANRCLYP